MPPKKTTTAKSAVSAATTKASAKPIPKAPRVTKPAAKEAAKKAATAKAVKAAAVASDDESSAPVKKVAATKKAKAVALSNGADHVASEAKAAPTKAAKAVNNKRKAPESESEDEEEAPKVTKKAKTEVAKAKATKPAPKKTAAKPVGRPRKESVEAPEKSEDEAAPKAKPAPKKAGRPPRAAPAAPTAAPLPVINTAPTEKLDVFVFGEGSAGELGLGAKSSDGKKVVDVTRPRLNERLLPKLVGVVSIAVGGMHCAALTHDNKILTWGVNDQGALGRTTEAGAMKDIKEGGSDSDSDSDDDDSGLNPSEAEPREVDNSHFPAGTKFAALVAGDSSTFALTTTGLVYGWGTFRANDGILGFRSDIKIQKTPMLIPELKKIVSLSVGTNHVLALDHKGKVFTWGAGEQHQLARRVVQRTAAGGLVPREFGLSRKNIQLIGTGDYNSFAVSKKGDVYSWGLNTFGQTGVPKSEGIDEDTVAVPTLVKSLENFSIEQVAGGAHHTLARTNEGKVLVWGRIDSNQAGMKVDDMPKDAVFTDESGRARYLKTPAVIPNIAGAFVATGNDTCIVVDKDGKAWSWGFSSNYQTGQGTDDDILVATQIDNTAVRGKKLLWAGVGGQFGILAGESADAPLTNGVH